MIPFFTGVLVSTMCLLNSSMPLWITLTLLLPELLLPDPGGVGVLKTLVDETCDIVDLYSLGSLGNHSSSVNNHIIIQTFITQT